MDAVPLEVGARKIGKLLSTMTAALALSQSALAQDKMSSDWLQMTPSNPKAGIASRETRNGNVRQASAPAWSFANRRDSLASTSAYEASKRDRNLHIVVSLEERRLWVVAGIDTVMQAPVAVGTGATLVFGENAWTFDTPRGVRTVRNKDSDPHWIPPDWHYAETAKEHGLKLAYLSLSKPTRISAGRKIIFRNGEAGVLSPDSGFALLPLEEEIVFEGTLYVPPTGSKNRQVQGELGKYKLDTGGGVLLHGTPHQSSIGQAATHGCMRLRDEDIEWLYEFVPVGTKIYIY
ncbi:MAG TPA: L,D-transpeptidase [Gemmatimonadaceae bacterium]|nr:L,D-transpeptidase [Gemmatimonadaceae bacterium]